MPHIFTETRDDGLTLSTDPARLQPEAIHRFLSQEAYWAKGRSREVVDKSLENSVCFAVYDGDALVAFTRVVTDFCINAYVDDVYVLPGYRGRGLGKWLVGSLFKHPDLKDVPRWVLSTLDAQGLYAQFGFTPPNYPERIMVIGVAMLALEEF